MPSNKELLDSIAAVVEEAGTESPDTKGMNNAELAQLLKSVKQSATLQEAESAHAGAVEEATTPDYEVAAGKAITSKRGILGAGEALSEKDLPGGADTLKNLVKKGHVVKN